MVLRKTQTATTLDVYKQSILDWFTEQGFNFEVAEGEETPLNAKTIDIMATTIFARRIELQTILTDLVLGQSTDKQLLDYNYNVEMVISSSTSSKVAQPMMVLELLLRVNQDEAGLLYSGK